MWQIHAVSREIERADEGALHAVRATVPLHPVALSLAHSLCRFSDLMDFLDPDQAGVITAAKLQKVPLAGADSALHSKTTSETFCRDWKRLASG